MIYRIDVQPSAVSLRDGADPLGESIRHQAREFGIDLPPVRTARVYLIDTDADEPAMLRVAGELLADPVAETATLVRQPPCEPGRSRIEVHLKPGVMDPVAASTRMAIRDMGLSVAEVRTGRAYIIDGDIDRATLELIATRVLANPVIENIHFEPFLPERFPVGQQYVLSVRHVPLRDLDDEQLMKLSREGHLFLSLTEMQAIRQYYREVGREPTDIELETLAQTWSEHCVHKTLKSAVELELRDGSGRTIARRSYDNLIKDTIFHSTMELMRRGAGQFCLSVFADNAGVIAFDEQYAVCFKVETHNHPSAIEPYGGSATGTGGVIRDVLGTGLGARPVANTDVFCVAFPDDVPAGRGEQAAREPRRLPRGVLHPRRILRQVVAGVRDYGNRMGIPTVNGAVYFDERYLGNPLVFCGCAGLIPRDMIAKQARDGDLIVLIGGRTGRDGIHGATFSSAELTDTHAEEFSHAVQIGNAIEEKRMADVVLQARDRRLFTAITDCGAGGLSSAVGEMGRHLGACVDLEKVPLKYAGLRYDEIWISEAQERMVLAVPPQNIDALMALARSEDVEATVIGRFGTPGAQLVLRYEGTEVGRLSMDFLHDGLPRRRTRAVAVLRAGLRESPPAPAPADLKERLLAALAHPNVASKHWIIRQYDHEVQGGSVVKPLGGPLQQGPSDAAVLRPRLDSMRGIAIACGLAPHVEDPYDMAVAAIDEALRNIVAVGGDLSRTAILDNFCWAAVDDERTMGDLARACEACRDAALAYGTPFISGKDSLNNQFADQETGQVIRIPGTLLISAISVVPDVRRCITPDLKTAGAPVVLVGPRRRSAGLFDFVQVHRMVQKATEEGLIVSCHDVSDGGALAALAEMMIASGMGAEIGSSESTWWFDEAPARYVVELSADAADPSAPASARWRRLLDAFETVELARGGVLSEPLLRVRRGDDAPVEIALEELSRAWLATLDW